MQDCINDKNDYVENNSSASTAHSRLLAMRGEAVLDLTDKNVLPARYCLLPSMRRMILTLSEYEIEPQVLPIIVGPDGCGKTSFAQYLNRRLDGNSSMLTGAQGISVNNLIKHIAIFAKVDIPQGHESFEHRLNILMKSIESSKKTFTLLVDQVDFLSITCLAALVYLVSYQKHNKCLSIILFGRADVVARVESLVFNNLHCVQVRSMPILPMSDSDIKVYVRACLQASGCNLGRYYFGDELIAKIKKLSGGLPANIQEILTREVLPGLNDTADFGFSEIKLNVRLISCGFILLMVVFCKLYAFNQVSWLNSYVALSEASVNKLASYLSDSRVA